MELSSASQQAVQTIRRGLCLLALLVFLCPPLHGQYRIEGEFDIGLVMSMQANGLVFYAIHQKTSGQCVVVVGKEGVEVGDTVYGSFGDFQQAQETVTAQCIGAHEVSARPASMAAPAASAAPLPAEPAAAISLFASPILAVPKYDNDDSTKGIFFVGLADCSAFFIDKVKGSPQSVRSRALNQNIFKLLGSATGPSRPQRPDSHRPREERQRHGPRPLPRRYHDREDGLHHEPRQQVLRGAVAVRQGRPRRRYGLQTTGNFALVMHQNSAGKTDGAILYHGTTGKSAYFYGAGALRPELKPLPTSPLPPTGGGVSEFEILAGSEATDAMLLLDPNSGSMNYVSIAEKRSVISRSRPSNRTSTTFSPGKRASERPSDSSLSL